MVLYEFGKQGAQFQCDEDGVLQTIFSNVYSGFGELRASADPDERCENL